MLTRGKKKKKKRCHDGDSHKLKSKAGTAKPVCSSVNLSTQLPGPAAVTCLCVQFVTDIWGLISLLGNKSDTNKYKMGTLLNCLHFIHNKSE